MALCVNFTTFHDGCPDDECIVETSDYKWIEANHPTAVAFSRHKVWNAQNIEECLGKDLLKKPHQGDIPKATINKILKIAARSIHLGDDIKKMLV